MPFSIENISSIVVDNILEDEENYKLFFSFSVKNDFYNIYFSISKDYNVFLHSFFKNNEYEKPLDFINVRKLFHFLITKNRIYLITKGINYEEFVKETTI